MARSFAIDIITPERIVYREMIDIIIVPALDGDLGVLAGHAPLVTGIKIGVIKIKKDGEEFLISTSGGVMEVQPEQVNLIVNSAELPHEIDVERAEQAKKRAVQRLENSTNEIDQVRARIALERAVARLKVAGGRG